MDDQQPLSPPLPRPETTVDFFSALRILQQGEKIRRKSWTEEDCYCFIKDGLLTIHRNNQFHDWIINDGDMEGTDWVIADVQDSAIEGQVLS